MIYLAIHMRNFFATAKRFANAQLARNPTAKFRLGLPNPSLGISDGVRLTVPIVLGLKDVFLDLIR